MSIPPLRPSGLRPFVSLVLLAAAMSLVGPAGAGALQAGTEAGDSLRPMTFLDVQHLRSWGSPAPSPDGRWLLHTVTAPNWEEDRSQTDIHLVSLEEGVPSSRRMTFTEEADETAPTWGPGGGYFLFLSNRDASSSSANRNELYLMHPDGGEARRITDTDDGVSSFAFSPDGQWLVFRSGPTGDEQLHRVEVAALEAVETGTPPAETLTGQEGGIQGWEWAPDSRRVYYVAPDSVDGDDRQRRDKGFTVEVRNQETPIASLWRVDMNPIQATRVAGDPAYSVTRFTVSDDGRWVGFAAVSSERYRRNITEEGLHTDLYLLDAASGAVERLTETHEVSPAGPFFSPDGRWVAFSAPVDLSRYSMANRYLHLRAVEDRGGPWQVLGTGFDGHVSVAFWSDDGNTVYFNEGVRATRQLLALDVTTDQVRQVTTEDAALAVSRDEDTGILLITYQDPSTPSTLYTTGSSETVGDRERWTRLTDVNPQVRGFALGTQREITWHSSDGAEVGGVLTLPVDYRAGERFPLIVAIHGGPASADVLGFNGGYGSQVYAGAGYAVLKPNYRGSTNYGEAFRTGIVGNYFPPGYEDIMAGVDHLIAEGVVDPERMGVLGWSAGGHWSNWILVNTDRFRAISSGAGTSNWISMYAQSDVQRNRQFYLGDELPYHDFEAYWEQSPLKYITNARTPTMIHVVEGDPRVPSPQSVELHMALRQLEVPTELFMYPGSTHGIPDARNRLLKSVSEMAWMDYWVRGIGEGFRWSDVLSTLENTEDSPVAEDGARDGEEDRPGGGHRLDVGGRPGG
jgi:dipeptidyl aminopeptidase/acylaminoacyl peptidase